jgi:bacillithiol biosynthesis deacetylase BshB1
MSEPLDVLAIGAHPDDADLGVGATLHKLAMAGYRTGILDLTRGELASRGTPERRAAEAAEAGKRLGLAIREQAGLPDGSLEDSTQQRHAVAHWLRVLRPSVVLAPMTPDRHPDHEAAHRLVRAAHFFAGVAGLDTGAPPFRPATLLFYSAYHQPAAAPAMVVDVSAHFAAKRHALEAFASQFYQPGAEGPETLVSSAAFWDDIETRARYWGGRVGVAFGEPLYHEGPLCVDLPPGLNRTA